MTSQLIQNTPEWHAFRRKRIGASDAPVIMRISPWKTPYQLWIEKTSGIESSATPQQKRGLELEEAARQAFEKMTGMIMFPKVVLHPTHDWMMASLDGIDLDGNCIVEIKCPGQADQEIAKQGKIPEKYFPQLQHQLAVTGLKKAFYFSFDGTNGVILEQERDESFITKMIDLEKEFWKCLVDLNAPSLCDRDFVQREDDEWTKISQKWLNIHRQLKSLEDEEKTLRGALIQMTENKNVTGGGIKLTRSLRKGNVQYHQIPELKDIDLEKYRKEPSEVWRLTAMNEKDNFKE